LNDVIVGVQAVKFRSGEYGVVQSGKAFRKGIRRLGQPDVALFRHPGAVRIG
jgi:hypothetical protein